MKTQYIRGLLPLHTMSAAAAATLAFAGLFILFTFATLPLTAVASAENTPPVGVDSTFTVAEGASHSGSVSGTDADGDSVTFALEVGPAMGMLTFNGDGNFTYTADSGYSGEDSFTFKVNDGLADSSPATISILVIGPDTTPPTGWIELHSDNGEVSGDENVSVSLQDNESLVKDACLWLGDESENLLADIPCKTLSERDWHSYDYAPSFRFTWDTTLISDGTYDLYVVATDNSDNTAKIKSSVPAIINNYSLGSPAQPKPITMCDELQAINNKLGWHYIVMNDIDCSETKYWNSGRGFVGISNSSNSFSGVLDGQNYNIYNLYQNQLSTNSGVFYSIGGVVKNINFRNIDIVCNSTYCGAFSYINSGLIEKSSVTGNLQCNGSCGSFASQQSGTISECWGDMVIENGRGGIAGSNHAGTIVNSYFKGEIFSSNVGGLVGINQGWARTNGLVQNSYSTIMLGGEDQHKNGGVIGWNYQDGLQLNSYWNKEKSGLENMCGEQSHGGSGCTDDNGLTDEEMKNAENYTDWDFKDIWAINPEKNDGYPYLQWQTSFTTDTQEPDESEAEEEEEEEETVTPEPIAEKKQSSSSGTRIGQRQGSFPSGLVLGLTMSTADAETLAKQQEIVRLLQEVVSLLQRLMARS